MSNPRPKFGDRVRNIYASEANPIRDAIYVRRLKNLDEVTDGKGDFWRVGLGALILIASPNAETKPRADWCCTNCGEKFDIDNAKVWRLNAGQLAHNCTGAGFFVAKNYALDEGAFRQEYGGSFVPHAKDGDRNG